MCVRAEGSGSCRLTFKRQEGFRVWSVDLVRREISHHTIGLANLLGHSCFCLSHPLIPILVGILKLRPINALIIDGHQRSLSPSLYKLAPPISSTSDG